MARTVVRARLLALVAVLPLALVIQSRASGQDPALEVFYTKLEPKEQFKYKWKGKEATSNAGVFRWEVPAPEKGGEFGTNGLDRNFTGYCAEILVPITAEKMYRFRINSIFAPANYGLVDKDGKEISEKAPLAAQRRATYIKELFGRYFHDPIAKTVNSDDAVAFQIALWEVIQETEPQEGEPKLDLFAGDFQANYPKAEAPAYVTRAQEYLDSLTGNDALFYENPDLRGRELIRLQGIENADKVVAQSQFALRYVGGGGLAGGARALTGGGGGAAGFGAPGGGFGFPGGGGGLLAGTGGGSTPVAGAATPSVNPVTTTSTFTNPSTSPSTTTTVTTPPTGGEDKTNNNPVPAPPAFLLALAALGTLGSWRLGLRLRGAK